MLLKCPLSVVLIGTVSHCTGQETVAAALFPLERYRVIVRSVPWFEAPAPPLLQDSLIKQCWTGGTAIWPYRGRMSYDLRAVDSCSCWQVSGSICENVEEGTRWIQAGDSILVAKWCRTGENVLSCTYRQGRNTPARRFRIFPSDTVRTLTEYNDRLDESLEEVRTVWFRTLEMP